jgi:hypothetical protein
MRSALFWDVRQRRAVISYQCFGTSRRSHLQGSRVFFSFWNSGPLTMGPTGYPESMVWNYHSTLRNIPEQRRFYVNMFQKHRLNEKLIKYIITAIIWYCRVTFPQNNKLKMPLTENRMNMRYRIIRTRK